MLNHITLMGRLTRDPELRYTTSQIPVASFAIAVDRDYSGKDGGEKETDFIDIVAWRHTADFVSKYFTKGRMAVVSGRLQIRQWTDKDGNKRRSAEVVADNVYFGDSKKDGTPASAQQPSGGYGGYGNQSGNRGGGYSGQQSMNGFGAPPSAGYPPSNYGGFSDLSEPDDGELPF